MQVIKDSKLNSKEIGKIIYEFKNTIGWNKSWELKLAEDMKETNSDYAILCATSFNKEYPNSYFVISNFNNRFFLTSHENVALVFQLIRKLIEIENNYKLINLNNNSKFEEWRKIKILIIHSELFHIFKKTKDTIEIMLSSTKSVQDNIFKSENIIFNEILEKLKVD
ncbi:DUF2130 domain-containing protein [Spiroplasma chrysopicola]|uniref:Uncharacterized protein n=1 Tax=Spiroplasma chrysopicola DF-1 TaxID=1276227 RepID=R4U368_9MOLU|nr:DUF2130 domain-containing protein [Spiroplasma chrysopicola]AGM24938.1 hypothetical protein SCHRY_v1c03550 [Spiroplasma chrysopicola DF-1]